MNSLAEKGKSVVVLGRVGWVLHMLYCCVAFLYFSTLTQIKTEKREQRLSGHHHDNYDTDMHGDVDIIMEPFLQIDLLFVGKEFVSFLS